MSFRVVVVDRDRPVSVFSAYQSCLFNCGERTRVAMMSGSPASSTLSMSPPVLRSDTIAALDSFLSSRAQAEKQFQELLDARLHDEDEADRAPISVDDFRRLFGEDWQMSQFWSVISTIAVLLVVPDAGNAGTRRHLHILWHGRSTKLYHREIGLPFYAVRLSMLLSDTCTQPGSTSATCSKSTLASRSWLGRAGSSTTLTSPTMCHRV
jgi:hypothetical protein